PAPPPTVPPPDESSTDEDAGGCPNYSSTSTASTAAAAAVYNNAREPTRVSTLKREDKEKKQRERIERERRELEERRVETRKTSSSPSMTPPVTSPVSHHPLGERTSYVEEPPSTTTTLDRRDRKAEKALVRRITNEMQMATYVHKIDVPNVKHPVGAYTPGVYRIRSLRFFEVGLRRLLWSLGKFLANRPFSSIFVAILCFAMALAMPIYRREQIFVDVPFRHLFGTASDVIANSVVPGGVAPKSPDFNYSNPAFTSLNFRERQHYAVLLRTISSRDTVLRKDAVLAYTALKKKLDHFPLEKREFLVSCSQECEMDRDMVDRIVKKSPQVAPNLSGNLCDYKQGFLEHDQAVHWRSRVETDTDGAISRAASLLMKFELRDDLSEDEQRAWQRHFDEQVRLTAAQSLNMLPWSPEVFRITVIEAIQDQYWWLIVCAFILFIFCFAASFGINAYQSKPLVGIMIFVALIVSGLTGLAMQFYRDSAIDPLIWPVAFVSLGIGLLWLFHLHHSWARYSSAAVHPTEKIAFILAHDLPGTVSAAAVVVVTFLVMGFVMTNAHMGAVFLGVAASVAIIIVFSVLFVSVFVYIGGRREARGVKWYQLFKTGDTHFTAPQLSSFDSSSLFSLHDRLLDTRPSATRAVGCKLIARSMRYPIVFFCTAYLIFAVWGCTNMRIDIKEEDFLPRASSATKFIEQYREQFGKTTQFLELSIENLIEYHNESTQAAIFDLLDTAVSDGYATRSISWLSEFVKFQQTSIYDITPDTFVPVANLIFLRSEPYRKFASDISLDRYQNDIVKSRMYLELTPKGYSQRVALVDQLLSRAAEKGLPISVSVPASMSLRHDLGTLSSGLYAFGIALVSLFVLSLIFLGQPALTFLLLFTSIAVLIETVGYAVHWGVPLNVITLTMALAGNALTCTIVMAFCYSYSMSGRSQIRAGVRIQYTFQATLVPVVFACIVPVVTYLPMFAVDAPIVSHIWKILVLNASATLIHYLFFLPNLMLLLSEHFSLGCSSLNCAECCCDMDDDSSIYYIPTGGRAIHPAEGIYQHPSYTYSVPKTIINPAPPHYLAIAGPPSNAMYGHHGDYGQRDGTRRSRRVRRHSENSVAPTDMPTAATTPKHIRSESKRRRPRRAASRDSEIYEAPPSPRVTMSSSRSTSPSRYGRQQSAPAQGRSPMVARAAPATYYDESDRHWRPYVQPQPYMFYPGPMYGGQTHMR
ncbi:unnamed protein product, partial [Caenorhabditis auriculariae]